MSAATARRSFYEAALSEAERGDFAAARGVEGLQDEIAILRLRLREAMAAHPEDLLLVERGVRLLIQSLLAEHRISSKEASGVTDAVTAAIERMAGALREAVE
jgi:hypothetical protein